MIATCSEKEQKSTLRHLQQWENATTEREKIIYGNIISTMELTFKINDHHPEIIEEYRRHFFDDEIPKEVMEITRDINNKR